MARKPNYSFERRQRELAKAQKKAARQEARARRRERPFDGGEADGSDRQADDGPPAGEEN